MNSQSVVLVAHCVSSLAVIECKNWFLFCYVFDMMRVSRFFWLTAYWHFVQGFLCLQIWIT